MATFHSTALRHVYLDFNASTPLAPEVVAAITPLMTQHFGNPSSQHWAGRPAREAVEEARGEVAALLGAAPAEIVFTSGGTEANNHAIKGVFFCRRRERPHIITTTIEHPAVLEPCRFLERLGASITRIPVDGTGLVNPDDIRRAITTKTVLVSVMHANNEVGTVEPIAAIARMTKEHDVLLHVDAAQSIGKIDANVDALGVDLLSLAGHKLYAPKGVGALYIRSGTDLEPLVHGAGHEHGRRAGTENVLLTVGLGAACRLARLDPCGAGLARLSAHFWHHLCATFGDRIVLNGHPTERLPNTLNISIPGQAGYDMLARLDGIAASAGSACHAGSEIMSPVLAAMGVSRDVGVGAIRFSLGRTTTEEELDYVIEQLRGIVG